MNVDRQTLHLWLHHWQDEGDAAFLYTVLASQEPDPLAAIRSFVERRRVQPVEGMPRFTGGAVGAIAYDAVSLFEPSVPLPDADPVGVPTAAFIETDLVLVFDLDDTLYPERQFALSGFAAAGSWAEAELGIAGLAADMTRLLAPGGELVIGFGGLWKSPYGGHVQFMTKLPSPSMRTTRRSGRATCAPIAAGSPYPIVPSPPEVSQCRGCRKR